MKRSFFISILLLVAGLASSHPLGIFSMNRYARIEVAGDKLRVYYVIDVAEVPTVNELKTLDANGDGKYSSDEIDAYLKMRMPAVVNQVKLTIDGAATPLTIAQSKLSMPEGQGGMKTLRIESILEPQGTINANSSHTIHLSDGNFIDRIGWKEIIARASGGAVITKSSVPSADVSNELRTYPQDMLYTPLHVSEADVQCTTGSGGFFASTFLNSTVTRITDSFSGR